jgi:hypothetical protein
MAQNPSLTPLIAIIIVVVLAGASIGGYLYYRNQVHPAAGFSTVHTGDNVTVNYVGIFGSGPENGKVFDTSLITVATNDAAWPKSLEYHSRGTTPKNYTTLDVHVGGNTPSSGYSLGGLSFIQVVTGFWEGLVGMIPNQTRTIAVPPPLGYGPLSTACMATLPLTYQLPIVTSMPGTTFSKLYPGVVATSGGQFADPHYGWTVLILSANATSVTLENLPRVGDTASPAGWPVEVTQVASSPNGTGNITLVNEIQPNQAGHLVGKDFLGTGPCSSRSSGQFILWAVNLVNGTYTENFNQEVQGQTLIFIVTVVNLFRPAGVVV